MTDKRSESQFIPNNKDIASFLRNNILGPAVGPSERRRRRAEGKKHEKMMNKEHERGDENWPPKPSID